MLEKIRAIIIEILEKMLMQMVLQEFELDENEETFLGIKCKGKGILAFILSLIGLSPTLELTCSKKEFLSKSVSLGGQVNLSIPVSAVTAIETGFRKHFIYLFLATLAVIFGMMFLFKGYNDDESMFIFAGLALVIATPFLVVGYKRSKTMMLGIHSDRGSIGVRVKKCVIEGVEIDFDSFEEAAALLNKAVYTLQLNKAVYALHANKK